MVSFQHEPCAVAKPRFPRWNSSSIGTQMAMVGASCRREHSTPRVWRYWCAVALRTSLARVGRTGILVWRGATPLVIAALEQGRCDTAAVPPYGLATDVCATR